MSGRPRRTLPVLALIVLVGVAAVGVIAWALARTPDPDATARSWLQAVAEGDAEAASMVMTADAVDPVAREALAGAAELIADPEVIEVSRQEDRRAAAAVSFSLGGETYRAELPLVEEDDGWRVAAGALGILAVTVGDGAGTIPDGTAALGDSVEIAGAFTTAGDQPLLPAVYEVRAAPVEYLDGAGSAVVVPGTTAAVAISPTLSAAARDAAEAEVNAYLDVCTSPAAAVPDNCGLRVPWPVDLQTLDRVTYRVEQRPVLSFGEGGTFTATGGVVVATATGVGSDGASRSVTYRDDSWGVRGTVTVAGTELRLGVL